MTICDLNEKPEIEYPLFWEYKAIFERGKFSQNLLTPILGERNFKIAPSHTSKHGKYESFNISVFVNDENERLLIFKELKKIAKFVL